MRYLKFISWLTALDKSVVERVAFEEVRRHVSTDSAHAYGGFMATLTAWCEANNIPYEAVPVGTIKKHATGKGNASKEAMIAAAVARGFHPKDDNEADALAILYWLLDHATPSTLDVRPSLHSVAQRRISVAPVVVARRRIRT
jgi:Holliday junction resolvasome RuvABC endonuclease subunit